MRLLRNPAHAEERWWGRFLIFYLVVYTFQLVDGLAAARRWLDFTSRVPYIYTSSIMSPCSGPQRRTCGFEVRGSSSEASTFPFDANGVLLATVASALLASCLGTVETG